jgi:hypothetical protein
MSLGGGGLDDVRTGKEQRRHQKVVGEHDAKIDGGILQEANIRGGGKTVHVVFKYLSRSLLQKGVGVGRSNASPSTNLFLRRRNRYSPPRCFFHGILFCF